MEIEIQRLKLSLHEKIQKWVDDEAGGSDWETLDTYVGDNLTSLMTDAAFAVLLAQKDLAEYYKREEMLND